MKKILIALFIGLLAVGCAQKKVVKVDKTPMPSAERKAEGLDDAKMVADGRMGKIESEDIKDKYVALSVNFDDVLFDFDSYEIRTDAAAMLNSISFWLSKNPAGVLIEGHCDERGTNEYNLALGDRRAHAVKSYFLSSGVSTRKIDTISYGEEKQQCLDQSEACWAKNRRAHFVFVEAENGTDNGNKNL